MNITEFLLGGWRSLSDHHFSQQVLSRAVPVPLNAAGAHLLQTSFLKGIRTAVRQFLS